MGDEGAVLRRRGRVGTGNRRDPRRRASQRARGSMSFVWSA